MKTKIDNQILAAEKVWMKELIQFLNELFSETFLPSHDVKHHLRTWHYAREILREISLFNVSISDDFVEAVLLATMFHDAGIIETRGIEHGKKSREIYLDYIQSHLQGTPALHDQIASAIELHDKKTENHFTPFHWEKPPDLLTITGMADDMDALGIIGIYRYSEIYLHRATPLRSLGVALLQNVSARYNNLVKACALAPSIIKNTTPGYQRIISFFDNYNQQLLTEPDAMQVYSGHIGVINYIRNFSVIGKIDPLEYPEVLNNFEVGKFVSDFFIELKAELEAALPGS